MVTSLSKTGKFTYNFKGTTQILSNNLCIWWLILLSIFLAEAYLIPHDNVCKDRVTEPGIPITLTFNEQWLNIYSVPVQC